MRKDHLHLWGHQYAHPFHLRRPGVCQPLERGGPHPHMAAASGRHIGTILKVAKIFNVPVDVITR